MITLNSILTNLDSQKINQVVNADIFAGGKSSKSSKSGSSKSSKSKSSKSKSSKSSKSSHGGGCCCRTTTNGFGPSKAYGWD